MTHRTTRTAVAALAALLLLALTPDAAPAGLFRGRRAAAPAARYAYPPSCYGCSCGYARPAQAPDATQAVPAPTAARAVTAASRPGAPATTYSHPTYRVQSSGADVLAMVNAARASVGAPPLAYDSGRAAWSHANCVAQSRGGMGHFVKAPYGGQCVGYAGDAATVVAAWMASPAHRAILLSRGYRFAGWAQVGPYWSIDVY